MSSAGRPSNQSPAGSGLRLLDLGGLVAGFGLAALLVRTVWPHSLELSGPPAVAFMLEYLWLGVAMSGPIILGFDPRRPPSIPPARPTRPGRLIFQVNVVSHHAARPVAAADSGRMNYSRAELAWMAIGGYWIALTFFVVPARTTNAPWTFAGLVPVLGVFMLLRMVPRQAGSRSDSSHRWTHAVSVALLWTWPIAWVLLYLLGQTL